MFVMEFCSTFYILTTVFISGFLCCCFSQKKMRLNSNLVNFDITLELLTIVLADCTIDHISYLKMALEVYCEPNQTPEIELIVKIVDNFQPLTIFAKCSI